MKEQKKTLGKHCSVWLFDAENIGSSRCYILYVYGVWMDGLMVMIWWAHVFCDGRFVSTVNENVRQILMSCWAVNIVKLCFVREMRDMSIDNSNLVNDYNFLVRVSKMKMVQSGKTDYIIGSIVESRVFWLDCDSCVMFVFVPFFCKKKIV